jgi:hypothetical protein
MKTIKNISRAIHNIVVLLLKSICPHWWKYYRVNRRVQIDGLPSITHHIFPVRECQWCKKTQSHPSPGCNGRYESWVNYVPSEEPMQLKTVRSFLAK